MSYILEALKKAQAERQLGETPGIDAPPAAAPVSAGGPLRKPLVAVVAAMAVVIVGLAAVVWRQAATPAQPAPALPPQDMAATRAPAGPPVAAAAAHSAAAAAAALPAPAPAPVVPAAPVPAPATAIVKEAPAAPAAVKASEPAVRNDVAPLAAAAPQSGEARGEEPVQAVRDLPEPIRRAIPPVAMSGYMYSPNPADRLVLIDKVLRREGDEVAPGLVLERLEPKGAVFAFRGYRYRMPY